MVVLLSSASAPCVDMRMPGASSSSASASSGAPLTLPSLVPSAAPTATTTATATFLTAGPSRDGPVMPPRSRRNKLRINAATQTDASELPALRVLQAQLDAVRRELGGLTVEMAHAEQRLKYEQRLELEARLRVQEERTNDKLNYLRKRAELHTGQVRAAHKARFETAKMQQKRQLQQLETALAAQRQSAQKAQSEQAKREESLMGATQLEQLAEDNTKLHEQINEMREQAEQTAKEAQAEHGAAVARLEAKLVASDKTVEVLRQQLAQARRGGGVGGAEAPALT